MEENKSFKSGVKNFFLDTVRGFAIGIAFIIPGFSGGSIAAILGIYEKLICAIADIFTDFLFHCRVHTHTTHCTHISAKII